MANEGASVLDFSSYITERTRNFTGREWVFHAINDWLDKPDGPRFFLLTGEPGSGKTAIAGMLSQFARGMPVAGGLHRLIPGFLDADHFCWVQDPLWIDPFVFAGSVATQLANRYPAYKNKLQEADQGQQAHIEVKELKQEVDSVSDGAQVIGVVINVSGPSPEYAFNRAVRLPLEALSNGRPDLRIIILVDSLDEALTYSGEVGIVSLLTRSKNLPACVRFIVTSRPEIGVLSKLEEDSLEVHKLSEGQGLAESLKEVQQHVLQILSWNPILQNKLAADLTLDEFAKTVRDKSDGNFLYVKYLLQMLEDQPAQISKQSIADLPIGLDGIYSEFLRRLSGEKTIGLGPQYQAILGTLAVAQEWLTEQQLANFTGIGKADVRKILASLRQFLEVDDSLPQTRRVYSIYHRSFSEFLLDEDRAGVYWCEAREQHQRIVDYYRQAAGSWIEVDWDEFDDYGLRHVVSHLRKLVDLASSSKQQKQAEELYAVVLSDGFRRAQQEGLGELFTTLGDLEMALDVALAHDDLVKALACAGIHRQAIASGGVSQAIFEPIKAGDLQQVQRRAALCKTGMEWDRVLHFYLAWEAAEAKDLTTMQRAMDKAGRAPLAQTGEFCDALLARISRTLEQTSGDPRSAKDWLAAFGREQDWLLGYYPLAQPLDPQVAAQRLAELRERVTYLEQMVAEGKAEAISVDHFADEERAGVYAYQLRDLMAQLAAEEKGREYIDRALKAVVINPYPRYRDIALVALGIATLSAPDASWVRERLQCILNTGLDREGVTFTFDLPAILLDEAQRRGLPAPELSKYLAEAEGVKDRWGTAVRARSASAAVIFRHGNEDQALQELIEADRLDIGLAGYATLTLLSLANRCYEFGHPERMGAPVWGSKADVALLDGAMGVAKNVRDPKFREQRIKLVEDYITWTNQPSAPELASVQSTLASIEDQDTRMVYISHVSARWSYPLNPQANPQESAWKGLKWLLPYALLDGTALDTLFGRLFRLRGHQLSDEEVKEAIRLCSEKMMTGRSWQLGQWR